MPNIDYDPQNPTDLLDRPIREGDVVAWGTTYGRSPALCIARIEKIRYTHRPPGVYKNVECPRSLAENYSLRLRPLYSTGNISWIDKRGEKPWARESDVLEDPSRYETKVVNVQIVKNVVKLDPDEVEDAIERLREKKRRAT